MRDPARIDRMLELLGKLWKMQPDQRLGQLLVNARLPTYDESALFNIEDDHTLQLLQELKTRWAVHRFESRVAAVEAAYEGKEFPSVLCTSKYPFPRKDE